MGSPVSVSQYVQPGARTRTAPVSASLMAVLSDVPHGTNVGGVGLATAVWVDPRPNVTVPPIMATVAAPRRNLWCIESSLWVIDVMWPGKSYLRHKP